MSPSDPHFSFADACPVDAPRMHRVDNAGPGTFEVIYDNPPNGPSTVSSCLGPNYEQVEPVFGVMLPSGSISCVDSAYEGATITITSSASVDLQKGAQPSRRYRTSKGTLRTVLDSPDLSSVILQLPMVTTDEIVEIELLVADALGHISSVTKSITVIDSGNNNNENPQPIASIETPSDVYVGQAVTIGFSVSDMDEMGNDTTASLVTGLFYDDNGIDRVIVDGLQGNVSNYIWNPQSIMNSTRLVLVTSDGNTSVEVRSDYFTIDASGSLEGTVTAYHGSA